MKKILYIFLFALLTNIIWENIHSLLYISYKGNPITEFILIRASFFDAFLITIISIPFLYLNYFKRKIWLFFIILVVIAIFNEWYGLHTSRWMYNNLIPIIPIINTGLSPTFQLGILGYISIRLSNLICKET
jgi:hypothetical protein